MEINQDELKAHLMATSEEFRTLASQHCQYHKELEALEARENARKQLGVEPTDEFDPDVAKKVNQRAQEEFDKTTPEPSTKGVVRPNVDDESGSDSAEPPSDD